MLFPAVAVAVIAIYRASRYKQSPPFSGRRAARNCVRTAIILITRGTRRVIARVAFRLSLNLTCDSRNWVNEIVEGGRELPA